MEYGEYKTEDFELAIILHYFKKKISSVEGNGQRKTFVFFYDDDIEKIKLDWINRDLLIEPRAFWQSMKTVKHILYSHDELI